MNEIVETTIKYLKYLELGNCHVFFRIGPISAQGEKRISIT